MTTRAASDFACQIAHCAEGDPRITRVAVAMLGVAEMVRLGEVAPINGRSIMTVLANAASDAANALTPTQADDVRGLAYSAVRCLKSAATIPSAMLGSADTLHGRDLAVNVSFRGAWAFPDATNDE